jgi:hypothetical protein
MNETNRVALRLPIHLIPSASGPYAFVPRSEALYTSGFFEGVVLLSESLEQVKHFLRFYSK